MRGIGLGEGRSRQYPSQLRSGELVPPERAAGPISWRNSCSRRGAAPKLRAASLWPTNGC